MAAHGALGARAGRARRILPPAAQAGRPPHPRLQHVVELASGGPDPVLPHRRRRLGALPQPDPGAVRARRLGAAPRQHRVHGRLPGHPRRVPVVHVQRRGPLVPAPPREGARGPDRLLLRRVRPARVPRHLLRRPRRPRRRPHEDGLGHGAAADRRRADVPQGLLPPDHRRGRAPGARLPRLRARAPADPARPRPARRAAHGQRPVARPRPVRGRLGRPGRPGARAAARHRRPRQRRLRPPDHPHPVRPRPRDAAPPGARPGRRRRPGAAGAGPRPRGLAPQRGPLRVPARGARPRARGGGPVPRRRVRRGPAQQRVHDPHPGRRGQRALRRRPRAPGRRSAPRRRRAAEHGRRPGGAAPGPRPGRRERPLAVRHDRAVPAHDARGERGLAAPRAHGERHLAGRQPARDPRAHQRRPHADLAGPADPRHARAVHQRRPRRDGRPAGGPALLGADRQGPGRRAVGGAPAPEARARDLRPRPAAQPVRPPRRGAGDPRGARQRPGPEDPDDRVRPPVRDLQAIGAAVHRPRPDGPPAVGRGAPACRSSSPARPTPPTGPARA